MNQHRHIASGLRPARCTTRLCASLRTSLRAWAGRLVLAYMLVLQGLLGATATGASVALMAGIVEPGTPEFLRLANSPFLCINRPADTPLGGPETPAPQGSHDGQCCGLGCMGGGIAFAPPARALLPLPGESFTILVAAATLLPALPRQPAAAFQPRAPPLMA